MEVTGRHIDEERKVLKEDNVKMKERLEWLEVAYNEEKVRADEVGELYGVVKKDYDVAVERM